MTVNDLLRMIKSNLTEKKSEVANLMVDGRMADFETYQKSVGIAEGLEIAKAIIDETMKKIDEEDV